jgi:hypothetical protein
VCNGFAAVGAPLIASRHYPFRQRQIAGETKVGNYVPRNQLVVPRQWRRGGRASEPLLTRSKITRSHTASIGAKHSGDIGTSSPMPAACEDNAPPISEEPAGNKGEQGLQTTSPWFSCCGSSFVGGEKRAIHRLPQRCGWRVGHSDPLGLADIAGCVNPPAFAHPLSLRKADDPRSRVRCASDDSAWLLGPTVRKTPRRWQVRSMAAAGSWGNADPPGWNVPREVGRSLRARLRLVLAEPWGTMRVRCPGNSGRGACRCGSSWTHFATRERWQF